MSARADTETQEDVPESDVPARELVDEAAQGAGLDRNVEMSPADCVALALRSNVNIRIAYLNRVVEKYNLVTDADFRYVPRVAIDGSAVSTGNENRDGDKTDTSGASGGVAVTERIPTAGEISFIWNGASRYEKTSGDESSHENVDSNSWKVALRQPLLKGAGLDYDMGMVRQAEITNQKNILSLKQTLIDELSSALTLYRSLLAAKYAMEISESSLEIANKNLEKAKVEVTYGRIPAMDIIQFESDVANRELSLEQSKNLYINARLELAKHLELDKSVLIIPSETLAMTDVELDEQESYRLALENRPAYLNDNLSIESQEITLMQADRDQLPQLDFTGSYGQDRKHGSNSGTSGNRHDWSVGLELSTPIFGTERRELTRDVLTAKKDLRVAQISLQKQKDDIAADVTDKIREIMIKQRTVKLARRARILAQGKLNVQEVKMRLGKSSAFELVTFQEQLFTARIEEMESHINYFNALNDFDSYLGTTLETWHIDFKDQRQGAKREIEDVKQPGRIMSGMRGTYTDGVLECMSEGVLAISEDGIVVVFNAAAGRILGVDPANVLGKPIAECFSPLDLETGDASGESLFAVFRASTHDQKEIVSHRRPDGGVVRLCLTFSHMEGEAGHDLVVFFTDVTQEMESDETEKRLNRDLRQATEELRVSNDATMGALQRLKLQQKVGIAFASLLVVGVLVWIWNSDLIDINLLSSGGGGAQEEVRTITVAPRDVSLEVSLSGTFEPLKVINVVAPFAATVAEKNFVWGQKVDKGTRLFSLDTGEVMASLRDAKSEYIKAKQEYDKLQGWTGSSEFKNAKRSLKRSEEDLKLKKKRLKQARGLKMVGIISNNDYEQAEEEYRSAENEVAANLDKFNEEKEKGDPENLSVARMKLRNAEEKLAALQLKVDSGVVLAPVLGVVLKPVGESNSKKTDIVIGSAVTAGQPLAAVGDLAGLRVVSKVDEVDVGKLSLGQKVVVTGDALPGQTFVGRISEISSTATSDSKSAPPAFDVQTTIEDLPPDVASHIRLGMSANLQVQVYDNPEALIIPIQAVHRTPQGLTVDILDEANRETRTVPVTTGVTTLSDVEITSGLTPGQQVVVP